MAIERLVIEILRPGHPGREEALLAAEATRRGIAVVHPSAKAIERGRFRPGSTDLVAGSFPFVRAALRASGADLPPPNPYPACLESWLHRSVWRARLRDALRYSHVGRGVFVKPAESWKRFTGFVVETPDAFPLVGVSRSTPVWCSDPVDFVSEWRVYVIGGEPEFVGLCDYGGDRTHAPDLSVIQSAIDTFTASGEAPAAYAIDFGVLSSGETALVEVNDGFSVGAYDGIPAATYWKLIATRWAELTGRGPN